jgi:hypothetical protein
MIIELVDTMEEMKEDLTQKIDMVQKENGILDFKESR